MIYDRAIKIRFWAVRYLSLFLNSIYIVPIGKYFISEFRATYVFNMMNTILLLIKNEHGNCKNKQQVQWREGNLKTEIRGN